MSRKDFFEQEKKKKLITKFALAVGLAIVSFVTVFVMYSKKLNDEAEANLFAVVEEDDTVVPNNELEPTSFSQDKTVQNVNYENTSIKVELENTTKNATANETTKNTTTNTTKEPVSSVEEENTISENTVTEEKQEEVQSVETELAFQAPIAGEIIKDYAMDTLIYSKTLDEWCTHCGIDIKADKASVVQASEKGVVESIKNDPRYGLTVIISHDNGFKTVYSNLLTTEFVQEGEEVEKGQTIATVGESASFEVADESHLHFEMYKDGITVNPTIYFK